MIFKVILLNAIALLLVALYHESLPLKELLIGDFLAYYSSAKLFLIGQNPYDQTALNALQIELGRVGGVKPLRSLYMPWFFLISTPFSVIPFAAARVCWFLLNLNALLLSIVWLGKRFNATYGKIALGCVAATLFVPILDVFLEGQVGVLLLLGLVAFTVGHLSGKNWIAATGLIPLTLKPHLFIVLGIYLVFLELRSKVKIIVPSLIIVTFLSLAAEIFTPGVHLAWMERMIDAPGFKPTATISSIIRLSFFENAGSLIQIVVAAIGAMVVIWWGIQSRLTENLIDELPLILSISLIVTPYAWVNDFAVLFIVFLIALFCADNSKFKTAFWWIYIFEVLTLCAVALYVRTSAQFFWFPFAVLTWWLLTRKLRPDPAQAN